MTWPNVLGASPIGFLRGGATRTFVVECYWPEITEEQVKETLSRLAPSPNRGDSAVAVHSFGCILVPSDGMALFLFRGPSEELVRERSERAEVPFDRVVESIQIGVNE
jgi:hypothetical protein